MEAGQFQENFAGQAGTISDLLRTEVGSRSMLPVTPSVISEPLMVPLDLGLSSPKLADPNLSSLFEVFRQDLVHSKGKLATLNPGRREMIECRLDFIARKQFRSRGERVPKQASLQDLDKEWLRPAWEAFAAEVALFNLFEIFLLKALDFYGWRPFSPTDLGRLHYAAYTFLAQRANGFAHDKHSWNLGRSNVYSWFTPSPRALTAASGLLSQIEMNWTDQALEDFVLGMRKDSALEHLEFRQNSQIGDLAQRILEEGLGFKLASTFNGRFVPKKIFFPSLDLGGPLLKLLDRSLKIAEQARQTDLQDESSPIEKAFWGCESESIGLFWCEIVSILKSLQSLRAGQNRIPQVVNSVQSLALALHNLEQLSLGGEGGPSRVQHGSAGFVQQFESFDCAVVVDSVDRTKSGKWLKALSEQSNYWRALVSSGSNLNWGELHLYLAATKLREEGFCIYLSHRVLPEGGDGDKLRRALLGIAQLEYFAEIDGVPSCRYLYVFRRKESKVERDLHRCRFGRISSQEKIQLERFEESSCSQQEIAERGWDHLFVRGAAPLVRHLNHKFPKLFQLATIQNFTPEAFRNQAQSGGLFHSQSNEAIEVRRGPVDLTFHPLFEAPTEPKVLIFPHNPLDLPWLLSMLNSSPARFWTRQELFSMTGGVRSLKLQELKSLPVLDLGRAPVGDLQMPRAGLKDWMLSSHDAVQIRQAKFVLASQKRFALEKTRTRFACFFVNGSYELKPEMVPQFYPSNLLPLLCQAQNIKIQYIGKERTQTLPEYWSIEGCRLEMAEGSPRAHVVITTRYGSAIQMTVDPLVAQYLCSQILGLQYHTWGEALTLLRLPKDAALFHAQTSELTRILQNTVSEIQGLDEALDLASMDLFEISKDLRQFL